MESYVYTISAVRSALRRGKKSVLLFLPNDGHLIKVTKRNLRLSIQRFNHTSNHGQA